MVKREGIFTGNKWGNNILSKKKEEIEFIPLEIRGIFDNAFRAPSIGRNSNKDLGGKETMSFSEFFFNFVVY